MIKHVPIASDFMSRAFVRVEPGMEIHEAIDLLLSRPISGAAVIEGDDILVGFLTDKDCLRVLSNEAWGPFAGGTVKDYMSPIKMSLTPRMDIFAVAHQFLNTQFSALPVVEEGRIIGVLSRRNAVWAVQQLQKAVARRRIREEHVLKVFQNPSSIEDMQDLATSTNTEQMASLLSKRHGEGEQK